MSKRIRILLLSTSGVIVFYVVVGGMLGKTDSSTREKTYRDLGVYTEVLSRIKSDYVTEPNLKKVTGGAVRGLLESLDAYSTYLPPDQYQDYLEHPNAGPGDVGLYVSKRMGFATIVSVLPGSPAEKGGIKPGDLIDRIDNNSTRELSAVQIQRALAGPVGSPLTLMIVRETRGEPQKVVLARTLIQDPPITAKLADENTAYVRAITFSKGRAQEIGSALHGLVTKQHADKIVLDLRDCAGGDVDEAVKTASLFMDQGLVAYASGQRYPRQDFPVKPAGEVFKQPLAVLINQSTAGAAELVAAAVQANKRGEVVGTRSFGVGVVQKLMPVGDGSALLLSVAKYYSPDGKVINDNGVTPTVVQTVASDVTTLDDENAPDEPAHFGEKDDQQFRKAIEVLEKSMATGRAA
jgi:carboxyl-terminal processing protease